MTHPRYKTRTWRVVRAWVLRRDGYECQLKLPGCLGLANSVDHIVRPEDGGDENHPDNLQAACVRKARAVHVRGRGGDFLGRAAPPESCLSVQ